MQWPPSLTPNTIACMMPPCTVHLCVTAVDVWLPLEPLRAAERLPVILHQARYYRSCVLRWPLSWLLNGGKPISLLNHRVFQSFLACGLAVVSMDVRGTGASFGKCARCVLCSHQRVSRLRALTRFVHTRTGTPPRGVLALAGKHLCPWSREETEDSREVLDWIVDQPWCNGNVGLW
jgi:uncharacterized protein